MTEYYYVYEFATGVAHLKGRGDAGSIAQQAPAPGYGVIQVSPEAYSQGIETAPLEDLKAALWDRVKARRDAVIDGGVTTPVGRFDTNAGSVAKVMGAALGATIAMLGDAAPSLAEDDDFAAALAILGQVFPITWTLADNSTPALPRGRTILAAVIAFAHVNGAHDRGRALEAAIKAAETLTALLQIDITAEWPGQEN